MLRTKVASGMSSTGAKSSFSNCFPIVRTHCSWAGEVAVPQIAYVRTPEDYLPTAAGRIASALLDRKGPRAGGGADLVPCGAPPPLGPPARHDSRDTERDVGGAASPRSTERVRHDHADGDVSQLANAGAGARGRRAPSDRA